MSKVDDYKKIIKSRKIRFLILNALSWIPDKQMLKIQYKIKLKRTLNLENPKRFTEKIQLYKLKYRNEVMCKCVDKYEVRKYVEEKGWKSILNDLIGIYDKVDDINFESLPDKFVIKTTNGGGGNNIVICNNKFSLDIPSTKKILNKWLKVKSKKTLGREWAYESNNNRIIIEKLLEGNNEGLTGINDYKFFCYNGKVEYIVFDGDRYNRHKRNFYDSNWNYIDVKSDCDSFGDIIAKPQCLTKMKKIAESLSKDFPFVRVDLYLINKNIFFGELTFYPWSGYVQFIPDKFDYELGKKFKI